MDKASESLKAVATVGGDEETGDEDEE